MSMYRALTKMTGHVGQAVKGPPLNHRLTFEAAGNSESDTIYDGTLVSLNASGKLVKGCAVTTDGINHAMPLFAVTATSDNGTVLLGRNAFGGLYTTLVATGGFEIETSEFVAATYAPNDALVPATGTDVGKVKTASTAVYSAGTPAVVGIVSQAASSTAKRLTFWSVFIPGVKAAAQQG